MCHLMKSLQLSILCAASFSPFGSAFAQSSPNSAVQPSRFVVYESFAGDSNADGQIMALNSSATYYFTEHFSARAALPIYFEFPSSTLSPSTTTASTSTSSSGIGDIFLTLHAAWREPFVNYSTSLLGTLPTGAASKGFSTGHFTFDWSNRFDRSFSVLTPFVDVGLANSVTDTPYFMRPFVTLGPVAHFEGGVGVSPSRFINVTASAYDIAPWGAQTIVSRVVVTSANGKPGAAAHGRPFETAHQTSGTAALTRDDGFYAGVIVSPKSYLDLHIGYTRSEQFALNTVSFGIGVNVTALLGKALRP
jgi:hypothetical protein